MAIPAVEISHLNHWFGTGDTRRMVLRDLNLSVEQGRTTFLMGPSGCGETTLLTLVGALRSVMRGSVNVLGHELFGADEATLVETRRRIGFVCQHHDLHRSLTVLQNVRMGLEVRGQAGDRDATARCMEVISAVDLAGHAHKSKIRSRAGISSGQRSHARWSGNPICCWRTSRPRHLTARPGAM